MFCGFLELYFIYFANAGSTTGIIAPGITVRRREQLEWELRSCVRDRRIRRSSDSAVGVV